MVKNLHIKYRWEHGCIALNQAKIQVPAKRLFHDLTRIEDRNLQVHLWIAAKKKGDDGGKQIDARGHAGRECDLACFNITQSCESIFHFAFKGKNPARILVQHTTCVRERYTSAVTFDQFETDLLFKVLNGFGYCWLANNKLFRSPRNMLMLCNCKKNTQIMQIHSISLPE